MYYISSINLFGCLIVLFDLGTQMLGALILLELCSPTVAGDGFRVDAIGEEGVDGIDRVEGKGDSFTSA